MSTFHYCHRTNGYSQLHKNLITVLYEKITNYRDQWTALSNRSLITAFHPRHFCRNIFFARTQTKYFVPEPRLSSIYYFCLKSKSPRGWSMSVCVYMSQVPSIEWFFYSYHSLIDTNTRHDRHTIHRKTQNDSWPSSLIFHFSHVENWRAKVTLNS
jgi:hypothetical protein